jgi:hypothetical protein
MHILQEVSYLHRILSQTLLEVDVQTIFRYSSSFSDHSFILYIYKPMLSLYSMRHIFIIFYLKIMRVFEKNNFFLNTDFYLFAIQASSSNIPFTYYRNILKIRSQYSPDKKQVSCLTYVIPCLKK